MSSAFEGGKSMSAIVFVVPENGEEVTSPNLDWLRQMVLHGGTDFWCSGSGQGWLKHPTGAELLLAFADRHGFFPEYIGEQLDHWIAFSENCGEGKVPVWIGGDPIIVSERFFVSAESAWSAVEEFCSSGERTRRIGWRREGDVEWSFGYWDHPDVKIR
jgi:hypothetical protein